MACKDKTKYEMIIAKQNIRDSMIEKRDYSKKGLMKETKEKLVDLILGNRMVIDKVLVKNADLILEINYLRRGQLRPRK